MKTSFDVDPEIWKRVRVLAAAKDISLGAAVDEALREWVAQRQAELAGIAEWVRSDVRQENEAEVARRVREEQERAYADAPRRKTKKQSPKRPKKGGDRR